MFSNIFSILAFLGIFLLKKKRTNENELNQEYEHFLCRFVKDGIGRKVGESVSLHGDIIIIKSGLKFLGVPLKHIEENGKCLLVKGLIDLDKAQELGEQWRKESFKDVNLIQTTKEGKNGV